MSTPLGGGIDTYQKYDPVEFPSPAAPPETKIVPRPLPCGRRLEWKAASVSVAGSPPDSPVKVVKTIVPGLEAETMSYHRIGERNARKLLELDPWHEATHRQLMGLLAATGQRSAALEQYERCRRLLRDELGVEPEQETTAEHLRIRAGTLAPPRLAPKTGSSLPAQTTPFVGREQEARQITALLDDRMARVVTLVGPGGIGKTRLAIRVAEAHRRSFRDGVYFVPLAGVTDTAVLASAIAGAIGEVLGA